MKLSDIRNITQNLPVNGSAVSEAFSALGLDPGLVYQEVEMDSKYVDTHQDITWSNDHISLHSHTYYEILYCRTATNVEFLVGPSRYRLKSGDIIFIPPGISHRPLLPDQGSEPYRRDVLWFSEEFAHNLIQPYPDAKLRLSDQAPQLLRTAGTKWDFLGDMFRTGVRESERRQPGWENLILGNTLQLLVHLHRAILERATHPPAAERPELLDQALAYIESHLSRKVTLADVARHLWVSQSTISQIFRNKMGVSFHRCLTQRRLIAAKLLISRDIPLEDVSHQVGFTDYSSFYRAFKQEFGISPRQYRKHLENSQQAASL